MAIHRDITYETALRERKSITPESIVAMIEEVRQDISELHPEFENTNLPEVLAIIETGTYITPDSVPWRVDLSNAKGVVGTYRNMSEGGCRSCGSLDIHVIDAQDRTSAEYCKTSDPQKPPGYSEPRFSGWSNKVRTHFHDPCDEWNPIRSPTIDQLLSPVEQTK